MLFSGSRMSFKTLFLKKEKVSEILILLSRLFHSSTVFRKYEFLKKICLSCIVNISCSISSLNGEDIEQNFVDCFLVELKNRKVFYTIAVVVKISNLILDKVSP